MLSERDDSTMAKKKSKKEIEAMMKDAIEELR
jgi:hypothetical protein